MVCGGSWEINGDIDITDDCFIMRCHSSLRYFPLILFGELDNFNEISFCFFSKSNPSPIRLATMPEPVEFPACGTVSRTDGSLDIVVQAEEAVFVYNTFTQLWRESTDGDIETDLYAAAAQTDEFNFFLFGGLGDDSEVDDIYR